MADQEQQRTLTNDELAAQLQKCAILVKQGNKTDPLVRQTIHDLTFFLTGKRVARQHQHGSSSKSVNKAATSSPAAPAAAAAASPKAAAATASTTVSKHHNVGGVKGLTGHFVKAIGLGPAAAAAAVAGEDHSERSGSSSNRKSLAEKQATSAKNAARAKADLEQAAAAVAAQQTSSTAAAASTTAAAAAKHESSTGGDDWCETHFTRGCACKKRAAAAASGKPAFQRPHKPGSAVVANGWVEQHRRSKMRTVWKEVLASLVEGRTESEETTLWIQREVVHAVTHKKELEALHQIPIKWLESVHYSNYSTDHKFVLKVYNSQEEYVFRCENDEEAAQNWVLTLRSMMALHRRNGTAAGGKKVKTALDGDSDWDEFAGTKEEEKKQDPARAVTQPSPPPPPPPHHTPRQQAPIRPAAMEDAHGKDNRIDDSRKESLSQMLRRIIHMGTPLYNRGQIDQCFDLYLKAAETGLQQQYQPERNNCGKLLRKALDQVGDIKTTKDFKKGAWILRRCFDEILAAETAPAPPPPAASPVPPPPQPQQQQQQHQPPPPQPAAAAAGVTPTSRMSVKELRAIAHGAGVMTVGMERGELERVVQQIGAQQARSSPAPPPPANAPHPPPPPPQAAAAHPPAHQRAASASSSSSPPRPRRDSAASTDSSTAAEAQARAAQEELARRRRLAEESAKARARAEEQARQQQETERRRREEEERQRLERERLQRQEEEHRRRVAELQAAEQRRRQEEHARQQQQQWQQQQKQWQAQQAEETRRRQAEQQQAEQQRRQQEEAYRQWHQQQQQQQHYPQQAQFHPQQSHFPGQQQQNNQHAHPPPPPPGGSPINMKYAQMAAQSTNDGGQAMTLQKIKHGILVEWALQPPNMQTLRPIEILVSSIHTVFPPKFGVPGHEHFRRWKVVTLPEVLSGAQPDDDKLNKVVKKLRFLLHPDKLPRDFSEEQQYMCKMLWDITHDAFEDHKKKVEELDWMK